MCETYTTPTPPTTDSDAMNNILQFSYQPVNAIFSLIPSKFTRISTHLECNTTCAVSFYTSGLVTLYKNWQTIVVDLDIGPEPWNLTVSQVFTGAVLLTFYIQQTGTQFGLYVSGDQHAVFSHGHVWAAILIAPVPQTYSNCPGNCYNCYNGMCYSCPAGLYLNGTACVATCPGGTFFSEADRKCVTECTSGTVKASATTCLPKCDTPGKYFIPGEGCVGDCIPGCIVCGNDQTCIQCHPTTTLNY